MPHVRHQRCCTAQAQLPTSWPALGVHRCMFRSFLSHHVTRCRTWNIHHFCILHGLGVWCIRGGYENWPFSFPLAPFATVDTSDPCRLRADRKPLKDHVAASKHVWPARSDTEEEIPLRVICLLFLSCHSFRRPHA